ncbi:hypothetical protein VMT65_31805 [Nocardia sp. CDC153]|uniref:hypothetical protein n=1 Tax=Nocardia sp. CDC153 TaxID=3112167 RepID=UPI002DB7CAD7|nr:hypothetical protein [Nocardia sp. CDC153]MEC3957657.1 hypothetical protein [Nocardia sp. CDC153]
MIRKFAIGLAVVLAATFSGAGPALAGFGQDGYTPPGGCQTNGGGGVGAGKGVGGSSGGTGANPNGTTGPNGQGGVDQNGFPNSSTDPGPLCE